jgi:DNA repair protein SbcC/Rad50
MRLLQLTLTNFRPFGHVELDLNADGLIGIRGLNGAGKSSLLAAVEWALFGQKRGAGSTPARRSGTPTGERCEVDLQFALDGRLYHVVRGERNARLWLDGELIAEGLTESASAVSTTLGLSRDGFTSTFYARQREIQALNPQGDANKRRRQLEDLLGLTRLRNACDLARTDAREQELVLRTLEAEATDHEQAKQVLAELEEQIKQHTPAVEAVRVRKEEVRQLRTAAWEALTGARERAEQAFSAETQAAVATAEGKAAAERRDATAAALAQARAATTELERLGPAVSRAAELRARDGQLEAHRQTHERATALRERRHTAEARRVTLCDQLATLAPIDEPSQTIATKIDEAEQTLQAITARLLTLGEEAPIAATQAQGAHAHQAAAAEATTIAAQIAELAQLRRDNERLVSELAQLDAQAQEVQRSLDEELAHREEIRRDGEAARCLRCKRPYGAEFETIILEYENSISALQTRAETLNTSIASGRQRQHTLKATISKLQPLEARKAALEAQFGPAPPADIDALQARAQALAEEQAQLRIRHDQHETLLSELRRRRDTIAASEQQRRQVDEAIREAQAEAELFARELAELPSNGYDPQAHAALRDELAAALAAEQRSHSLSGHAEQLPLLEHRFKDEQEQAQAKAESAQALTEAAGLRAPDRDALAAAQAALEIADEALAAAATAVQQAEEQALRESAEVQTAREALERARKHGQRLKKERLELRYRAAAATVLKDYNSEAQRRAFPTVARETSELLGALTHGRYSDARLDDSGALELHDNGAHHPLRRFSGGEQDLANLCLRIALSRSLSRQRGTEAGFIILDEVFGSQDLERRRALIEQLKELRHDFRQVFVVSHFDDVVDECDLQIDVVRQEGLSTATPQPR